MCVTLWQDFIGSTFLAAFARPSEGVNDRPCDWILDLHAAPASSKPSPYLPLCVVASKQKSDSLINGGTRSPLREEGYDGESISVARCNGKADGEVSGGSGVGQGTRVAAWCDKAGKPVEVGAEPCALHGELEVGVPLSAIRRF